MRDHRKDRKPTERHESLARAIVDHVPIQTAMIAHGYSPKKAKQGIAALPKTVLKLLPKIAGSNLMELGKISVSDQETLVRGRLVYNAALGQDKGVLSAKTLGSEKRLNMFTPDVQTGIIVITPPQSAVEDKSRVLDAEE